MDYKSDKELLSSHNDDDLKELLENERYFSNQLDFEYALYAKLVSNIDPKVWSELSKDTTLSKVARARAAYVYTFLTDKPAKLFFNKNLGVGFYFGSKPEDGYAHVYGLKNGIDVGRLISIK